jgi:uncharacterized protein (DUF2132 family)
MSEMKLNRLLAHYGWEGLASLIRIRWVISDPSIKVRLKFLRRTPWERAKVESLYLELPAEGVDESNV